jgi:two-component system, OmpR family, phosphate regulon sensor histidine kinase PhoR
MNGRGVRAVNSDRAVFLGFAVGQALIAVLTGAVIGGFRGAAIGLVVAVILLASISLLRRRRAVTRSANLTAATSEELLARLRDSTAERNRLETTLASIVEGVVAVDQGGRTLQMNGAAARFLHANVRTDLGAPFSEICKNREISELVRLALTTHRFQKKESVEGGTILDCYAGPLSEGAGAVLVLHDITDVRRLEAVRRDFVANVSHELKTPLTAIKGYVETLLEGGLDDRENNLRFLDKVNTHANRLSALITDLLSLSRIESGEAVSKRETVFVGEVLSASMNRLYPSAERKGIRFGTGKSEPGLKILGDPEALNQIFDNLIDNAIKYTERGGRVEVSLYQKNGKVIFEVEDDGVGIPPEDLPRIFERFYRVDKARSREQGGTGLGLSIVRHLAQALQGEAKVRSRVGVGSVFTVVLPSYTSDGERAG